MRYNFLNHKIGISSTENQAGEEAANRHENEADINENENDAGVNERNVAWVSNNPEENSQRDRLAKHFCTPEGAIKHFNQWERVNRTGKRLEWTTTWV